MFAAQICGEGESRASRSIYSIAIRMNTRINERFHAVISRFAE